ncbi:MAG: hypothetical protein HYX23_00090 [Candidatus Zambryskibacteria bacterium]|nr:hypothetical protein [Candidatus Zambryskibacteria bacterium]
MADQETKEKPYERRVREVINEELAHVDRKAFPEGTEEALDRVVTRLASDQEYSYQNGRRKADDVRASISGIMLKTWKGP